MTAVEISNARLLKLAEFLKAVPRKRFNYVKWVGSNWLGAQDLSCGTTACALGWAATMPTFRRLGLRLRSVGEIGYVCLVGDSAPKDTFSAMCEQPFRAARKVFGISENDAMYLFSPESDEENATPKQVAKKIEQYVAERV